MWNEEFSNTMLTLGFKQLKTDYCCFIQHDEEEFTILIVWVDDILAISLNNAGNDIIKQELKGKFEVNSIGKPNPSPRHETQAKGPFNHHFTNPLH